MKKKVKNVLKKLSEKIDLLYVARLKNKTIGAIVIEILNSG
tara:strand:+ start:1114 stop:1236 length:123 start_codon:yes stop_codon:yes gene_type:complete